MNDMNKNISIFKLLDDVVEKMEGLDEAGLNYMQDDCLTICRRTHLINGEVITPEDKKRARFCFDVIRMWRKWK